MQEMCVSLAKSTIDLPDDDAKVKTRFCPNVRNETWRDFQNRRANGSLNFRSKQIVLVSHGSSS